MSSSRREQGPDAPTRLAEKLTLIGDRFRTDVYHIEESDTFLIIDYKAKAEPYDFVCVARVSDNEIKLSIYDGQPYLGVARILEFYQLTHSEQWTPRIRVLGIHLIGFALSILSAITPITA